MISAEYLRAAFGWNGDVVLTSGPRGAIGQIWRADVGSARYAVKETFAGPPSEALIAAELAFASRAVAEGVRLPASHLDRDGRYLLTAPGGTWLRLYDWVDLRPVDPVSPAALGDLLARLHRCAPPTTLEPGGPLPTAWFERAPAPAALASFTKLSISDAAWASRLVQAIESTVPGLLELVAPTDSAELVLCHRDLHPGNVLAGPSDELVVVDWDLLGPAVPSRELALMLFFWFFDGEADVDAMCACFAAYRREGGPGRVRDLGDFSMLIATRLNFLLAQVRAVLDPTTAPPHRAWADREVDETLRCLPTRRQLDEVIAALAQVP